MATGGSGTSGVTADDYTESALRCALDYAARGWKVLFLEGLDADDNCLGGDADCAEDEEKRGKHPYKGSKGVYDATGDPDLIRRFIQRYPQTNLGIAAGDVSGELFVLDVDVKHGKNGELTLAGLQQQYGPLPATRELDTKFGRQLWFTYHGPKLANRADALGEGLDIRTTGGYTVAPPSRRPGGFQYRWLSDIDLAPVPAWIVEKLTPKPRPMHRTGPRSMTAFGRAVLDRYVAQLRNTSKGKRNDTMSVAGIIVGHYIAGGQIDLQVAERELIAAARDCGLGENEIRKSLSTAIETGMDEPWYPPPADDDAKAARRRDVLRPKGAGAFSIKSLSKSNGDQIVESAWDGRLVRAAYVPFVGEGGIGKSTVIALLAAAFSGGSEDYEALLPGWSSRTATGDVVILSYEDSEALIRSRCRVFGANLDRIHVIEGRHMFDENGEIVVDRDGQPQFAPVVAEDIRDLHRQISRDLPDTIMFSPDPWNRLLEGQINKPELVTPVINAIARMAKELNLYVPIGAHFNSSSQVAGYRGFSQGARGELQFRKMDTSTEDTMRVAVLHEKHNWTAQAPSLLYEFRKLGKNDEGIERGWFTNESPFRFTGGTTTMTSSDFLRERPANKKQQAEDFLRAVLADGPLDSAEIDRLASEWDPPIREHTLRMARDHVCELKRFSSGHAAWQLK